MKDDASIARLAGKNPPNNLGGFLHLKFGRVESANNGHNSYLVVVGGTRVRAIPVFDTGNTAAGVRGGGQYLPGSFVLVAGNFGETGPNEVFYIIGGATNISANQSLLMADQDNLLSGAGFVWDKFINELPLSNPPQSGIIHANNATPLDAVGGEWGKYAPLGTAIHLGMFMAFLRASDRCGVWAFNIDDVLRIAGKSVEYFSDSKEAKDIYDDGEFIEIERRAFLPWEGIGATQQGQGGFATVDETKDQSDPNNPPTETPVQIDEGSDPIYRSVEMGGYVADMKQLFVSIPVDNGDFDSLDSSNYFGVFHQKVGSDGAYSVKSAKSIILEKYSRIPYPVQIREQTDPEGDNRDNYRFSGEFGEGPEHNRSDFDYAARDEYKAPARSVLGLEMHGFNQTAGQIPLNRHEGDWDYPDEKTGESPAAVQTDLPLDPNQSWMPLPRFDEVTVQRSRWESVKYYQSRAAVEMADDGSITIEDGWGSQIIMSGGNIILSAANDVISMPGRNIINQAGQDIIHKANNSIDATAGQGDLRLKAEKNLEMLAAVQGDGGVLIESRAVEKQITTDRGEDANLSGVLIKSNESAISYVGKDHYMYALDGPGVVEDGEDSGGKIYMVTTGQVYIEGEQVLTRAQEDVQYLIGTADEADNLSVFRFGEETVFGATQKIEKVLFNVESYAPPAPGVLIEQPRGLVIDGTFTWKGNGIWPDTNIVSEGSWQLVGSINSDGGVVEMTDAEKQAIRSSMDETITLVDDGITESAEGANEVVEELTQVFTVEAYLANPDFAQNEVFFTFRTDEQYLLAADTSFVIPQFRWQQYAEQSGRGTAWEQEPLILPSDGTPMYPWPGEAAWTQQQAWLTVSESTFFDVDEGLSQDFDSIDPTTNTVAMEPKVLQNNFIINTTK